MRRDLEACVADVRWTNWASKQRREDKDRAETIAKNFQDKKWWKKVKMVVDLCWPIVELLKIVDAGTPSMGKIYFYCSRIAVSGGCQ